MKNILITGVCGGMGYETAKFLHSKGYYIFGLDRNLVCDLPIRYFSCDLKNMEDIERVYTRIASQTDQLDAIVHFAGIYMMNSLIEIPETELLDIFHINVFGIYRINKTFFPLLHKGSRIIMTSSELAPLDPLPFTGIYGITKTTVEKYAYSLRMELKLHGIEVAVIRPGAVQTSMLDASTRALDALCAGTKLYKNNTKRFRKIIDSVETKNVKAEKIAGTVYKIICSKKPKYIYNINRNILLRLLNALPARMQVGIISEILKEKTK